MWGGGWKRKRHIVTFMRVDFNYHWQCCFRWALQVMVHHSLVILRKLKKPRNKLDYWHVAGNGWFVELSPIFIRLQQITGWFAASKLCWVFVLSSLVLLMLLFEMQRAPDVTVCVTQITGEWLREEPTDQHDKREGKRGYRRRFVCLLYAKIV